MKCVFGIILTMILLLFSGCQSNVPVQTEAVTRPAVEQISMVVTELDLVNFETDYPDLKEADFTGSTCYKAIEAYKLRNPQVQVKYTVSLGGMEVQPDVTSLTLREGDFDYPTLRRNLQYLPNLTSLAFDNVALFPASISELESAYPQLKMEYSIEAAGMICARDVETLDLSAVSPEKVLADASKLALLSNLKTIRLSNADGESAFSLEQAVELQHALPNVFLDYTFALFDQIITTSDEEVIFHGMNLANKPDPLQNIRNALTVMKGCKRFVLDSCSLQNEDLAAIREEFRGQTKVVWRIWYGLGSILTDRTIIRHVYDLFDHNSKDLIYCEDAEFIDFGHNSNLSNCEYVSKMPKLRAIILSGSMISDLTPFAACESLEFLEIAYCSYVTDLSPLANCKNLKRLNIAYTSIDSIEPLFDLELDVLVMPKTRAKWNAAAEYWQIHPDTLIQITGDPSEDNPYIYPWRYEKDKVTPNEYYAMLQEKFHYPNTFNTLY